MKLVAGEAPLIPIIKECIWLSNASCLSRCTAIDLLLVQAAARVDTEEKVIPAQLKNKKMF